MNKRQQLLVLGLAACVTAGCAVTPPEEDPVQIQLAEIERRLAALERVIANGSLVDLTMQVDKLQRENAELRGRAETLEYEAETTASRQRDLYVDLDERIRTLESQTQGQRPTANVLDGGLLEPGELPVPGGSDRDNYQAAFELLKEQRYDEAAIGFEQFLVSFPESQLAGNAQYWLAEAYYVTDQFEKALEEFEAVVSKYPDSRKVPDAMLKIGYCNYELENWSEARAALEKLAPDGSDSQSQTTAAQLAAQRLKRMDEEGH